MPWLKIQRLSHSGNGKPFYRYFKEKLTKEEVDWQVLDDLNLQYDWSEKHVGFQHGWVKKPPRKYLLSELKVVKIRLEGLIKEKNMLEELLYPRKESDGPFHIVSQKIKDMSSDDVIKSMKDCGIIDENNKLTETYKRK